MEKINQSEGKFENLKDIDLSVILEKIDNFDVSFGAVGTTIDSLEQRKHDAVSLFDNNTYKKYQYESSLVSEVENILKNTGLDLRLEKEVSTDVNGGEELEYEELVPYLKDGKLFTQYLKSIDPNTITQSQLEGIGIMSYELVRNLYYSDISDPKNENFYEIITNGELILNELKRIGVVEFERRGWGGTFNPVLLLENLMINLKEGCLNEFLISYKLERGDMSSFIFSKDPEIFKQDWENILTKILIINKNPKADKIFTHTVLEAKKALEEATLYFQDSNKDKHIDDKTTEKFIKVIETLKARLEDF